jgi:predicted O-linked N-acetylglucosamine transferase (SPINDLY family)
LTHIGRPQDAISVLRHGLEIAPASVELWFNLGNALALQPSLCEAIDAYRQALDIDPRHHKALINLGNALRVQGKPALAVDCFQRAIAVDPASHDGYNNCGVALLSMGCVDEAIESFNRAIELRPESSTAYNNLGNALKDAGRMDEALAAYQRAMQLNPNDSQAHSNFVYALSFHPAFDDVAILRETRLWAAQHAIAAPQQVIARDPSPDHRLRIGYISPDFREHCQSLFTIPLLANHDREQYEIYCYAHLAAPDAISRRIESYADVWRPIFGLNDEAVADMVRADEIDILVDLTMHMSNGRPLVLARKPAPVQIAWLAYPGTTGQVAIDYRFTDPWLDPPDVGDDHYSEVSIRLESSFWCYDPMVDIAVNALPALENGYVTFGCLNNFCKVSHETLALWAKVLRILPTCRLQLLAPRGESRERVLQTLLGHGIASERITFVEFRPREQYLRAYHGIDICLDTLPYNGHTTSLDAFWMGVPVISRVGRTVAGRAGWSQLNNLGMSELAATGDEQFVQIARGMAQDIQRLSLLRLTLRQTMQLSPLMDGARFARSIEESYRRCWRQWCERKAD